MSVAVVALLCAVVGMPQPASAAGSYGAVVETGFRGCTTAPESGVVLCFASPGVSSVSRELFLQAWRTAHLSIAPSNRGPATLFVRAVSVTAESPWAGRPGLTYLATADLVGPGMACRQDARFRASDGAVRPESVVITCRPGAGLRSAVDEAAPRSSE